MDPETIFKAYSPGVSTARDEVVYGFDALVLRDRVEDFCKNYNAELDRYKRSGKGKNVDDFLDYSKIKWSSTLKLHAQRGDAVKFLKDQGSYFDGKKLRWALYRPFTSKRLYLDAVLVDRPGSSSDFFPATDSEEDNRVIVTSDVAYRSPSVNALVSNRLPDLHLCASVDGHQSFAFYAYESDGKTRHENITGWALEHFRDHYNDEKITKWDIFYYVYGVLHHPEYRTKYAENLKRELPRIPLAEDFWGFSKAGKELARLHVEYESMEPYPLKFIETSSGVLGANVAASLPRHGGVKPPLRSADLKVGATIPLSYRVEDKMRLAKDRRSLKVNDSLTLGGIPPETFEYRLGNRSALEWVIDQYQVTEDKHSGIRSDPNRPDDPEYIVRLVGQVIYVSLETVKIVKSLPGL